MPDQPEADVMQGMDSLPANDATKEISDALAAAVKAAGVPQGVILMLVQPGEKNSYDQQVCPASCQQLISLTA